MQADPTDVYKYIENDLKYAIDVLPYATEDELRGDNKFRLSKGACIRITDQSVCNMGGCPLKDTSKWELAAQTASFTHQFW